MATHRDPLPPMLTPDEAYAYRERLAILCGEAESTQADRDMAMEDVKRLQREQKGELL